MSDIQDKIRKLLALANDKGASEGEAANAMQMATALMMKYNITHLSDPSPVNTDARKREYDLWEAWLLTIVGKLNGCKAHMGRDWMAFTGREENRLACWQMFEFIAEQIERLYKRDLPKGMTQSRRANFRRTYKQAAATRVYVRGEEILLALRTKDNEISGCTALVVAQTFDQMMGEAEQYLESKGITLRSKTSKTKVGFGTLAGMAAGEEVKINPAGCQ